MWCCCRCRGKDYQWACSPSSHQARPALAAWASAASPFHLPEQLLPRRTPLLTCLPSDKPRQLTRLAPAAPRSNIQCLADGILKACLSQHSHSLLMACSAQNPAWTSWGCSSSSSSSSKQRNYISSQLDCCGRSRTAHGIARNVGRPAVFILVLQAGYIPVWLLAEPVCCKASPGLPSQMQGSHHSGWHDKRLCGLWPGVLMHRPGRLKQSWNHNSMGTQL